MTYRKDSIWRPLISTRKLLLFIYTSASLIALAALTLPPHWPQATFATTLTNSIPDVKRLATASVFPLATAVAYFLSLTLAWVTALLTCFSFLKSELIFNLTNKRSSISRIVLFIGILLFLLLPYFMEINISDDHQRSSQFFNIAATNRFFLLLWTQGIFLGSYVVWVWVLVELTSLYYFIRMKKP